MGDGCYQDVMVDADAMQAKRIDAVFWCSFISLSLEDFSGGKMRGVDLHPPLSMDFVNATRNKIDATLRGGLCKPKNAPYPPYPPPKPYGWQDSAMLTHLCLAVHPTDA